MRRAIGAVIALAVMFCAYTAAAKDYVPDHRGTSMENIEIGTMSLNKAVMSYSDLFRQAGDQYGVDPNLLAAICMQESSGRNLSVREDGSEYPAWGIMQIEYSLVPTFEKFGEEHYGEKWTGADRLDESKAIPFAAYLISQSLIRYDCDYMKMIQSYNFGQTVLDRIIEEKGDDWLSERANAAKYASNWPYATYGDAEYIEHVLRYYHDDIDYRGVKLRVNGRLIKFDDQYPMLETVDGETYTIIPIRGISEALDASVDWEQETQTVTIKKDRRAIELSIGADTALINGNETSLEIGAMIKNGRTMVPLRFVAEAFGVEIAWDSSTRTVYIETVE